MTLSKSLYTRAIQCPKALWLKKYNPSITTPDELFKTRNRAVNFVSWLFANNNEVILGNIII